MNSVKSFRADFLGFKAGLVVDTDSPLPPEWAALLPLRFEPENVENADFVFHIKLRLEAQRTNASIPLPFLKKNRIVRWTSHGRLIRFKNKTTLLIEIPFQSACLTGESRWQLASEVIESWLGWHAETNGFLRLHALAIAKRRYASVLIARQGFGKTTLALNCVRQGIPVVGEEVVFVKNDLVHPVHIVLREKSVEGAHQGLFGPRRLHRIGLFPNPVAIDSIYYGIRSSGRMWALICKFEILVGRGLPQNLDLTFFPLSSCSFVGWFRILRGRLFFIRGLKRKHFEPFLRSERDSASQTTQRWLQLSGSAP